MSESDIQILRVALIRARECYCLDECEHGNDGLKDPDRELEAAFDVLGMNWGGDIREIYHGDKWTGNEQFKPK